MNIHNKYVKYAIIAAVALILFYLWRVSTINLRASQTSANIIV